MILIGLVVLKTQRVHQVDVSFQKNNLIAWLSKKQNCVSFSTTKAKYIAIGSRCTQLLWMKQMLKEYNIDQETMILYCDNMSAINFLKNLVQHS